MTTRDRWIVIGSVCVTVALAVQVWRLDREVDALSQQLQSRPPAVMISPVAPQPAASSPPRPLIRLLASNDVPEGHTEIGIPWNVEQAMLVDGQSSPEN